jgi:hypothetical protein
MPDTIDTTKVTGRRSLRFASLDDVATDVERLANAKDIRTLGNWSAGQIFQHLANAINHSIDGFGHRLPAMIRFFLRVFFKGRILRKPMSAGFQLPASARADLIPPPIDLPDGLQSIRAALARLHSETPCQPHPAFGPLTPEEWLQLHCRHSELHLSFLVPAD